MDKVVLRNELIAKISSLGSETLEAHSFALTRQLSKLFHSLPMLSSQIGAGYLPLRSEIAPVYQELLRENPVSLAFPVLVEGEMSFGLPQGMPRGGTWLESPYLKVEPEWFLVPGVGFDLSGARLGRGKGFYDRYFAEKSVLKIGLAWTGQIVTKVPVQSHDMHMDYIITEEYCWDVEQQTRF